jgi:hypothetical protein
MAHCNALRTARRSRLSRAALATAFALALTLGLPAAAADERPTEIPYDTPTEIPQLDPSYRLTSHKVVLITNGALNPKVVTLEEGQLVAWISYAQAPSVIVFEREVARNMICHSLVNFSIQDDELRSAPIHPGEFASFCQLKPGRYNYKIIRPDPKAGSAQGSARQLDGAIIVGNPS